MGGAESLLTRTRSVTRAARSRVSRDASPTLHLHISSTRRKGALLPENHLHRHVGCDPHLEELLLCELLEQIVEPHHQARDVDLHQHHHHSNHLAQQPASKDKHSDAPRRVYDAEDDVARDVRALVVLRAVVPKK